MVTARDIEYEHVRAGFLTLTEARATLRAHPEWLQAYRGDLQVHTTWSDGGESLPAACLQRTVKMTLASRIDSAFERGFMRVSVVRRRSLMEQCPPYFNLKGRTSTGDQDSSSMR